jgi:hypothetical protein
VTWAIGHRPRTGREETVELNTRIDLAERAGLPADVEAILEQLRLDLSYGSSVGGEQREIVRSRGQILRRDNIGQILRAR